MLTHARFFLLFALMIGGAACGSTRGIERLQFNPSHILSYSFELEKAKHLPAPYVARFTHGSKVLLFVASQHVAVQEGKSVLEHPTLKTIDKVFADDRPDVVIVEGLDTGRELSPRSVVPFADKCVATGYRKGCGESFFAINTARRRGVHYITGEPTHPAVRRGILQQGFSTQDLLGFYMVRQIPQMKRQGEFDSTSFTEQADRQLTRFQKMLGVDVQFGYASFEAWYKQHHAGATDFGRVTVNDAAPHGGRDATYVQRISNRVTYLRDASVVDTIERMLEQFNRVLVVYGGSHLIVQEPALAERLGPATFVKLF